MNQLSFDVKEVRFRSSSSASTYELDFVTAVTRELLTCSSREEILARLPRLLAWDDTRVTLWQRQGKAYAELRGLLLQPATLSLHENIIGTVLASREPSCVNQPFQPSVGALPSTTALPLFEQEELLVVLKLERDFPFEYREYKNLIWLASVVSYLLTSVAEQRKSKLITDLSKAYLNTQEAAIIAERTLEVLVVALKLESGVILEQQGSAMRMLASVGVLPESFGSLSVTTPWLEEVHRQGSVTYYPSSEDAEPKTIDDTFNSFLAYPLAETLPARYILFLASHQVHWWSQAEKDLLRFVAHDLCLALYAASSHSSLQTLLSLESYSLMRSEDNLLNEVVLAAVQTVPGADAGRLLLYNGKKFHFRAAVGYDMPALQQQNLRPIDIKHWPHPTELAWDAGEPRIFSVHQGEHKELLETTTFTSGSEEGVRAVKAMVYFPIVQEGRVLAILMLENFSDAEAFALDSLKAVQMFQSPIALLLREQSFRTLMDNVALTDPLTELENRTSFNIKIAREAGRSKRYLAPFSLLIISVEPLEKQRSSREYDRHSVALVEVARTLKKVMRPGDMLFRWGNDELAAILPNTGYEGGVVAARRCARALKRIPEQGQPQSVYIGVASYPTCAETPDSLINTASVRLAKGRTQDITVFLANKVNVGSLEE
jgi:diguanylate cyclase (GGDEF)-like protein